MKKTALTEQHIALGAKMSEFAGYMMPIVYSGIKEEHRAVRNNVGIFDVSHMGEFIVKGKEALQLVQRVTSNDAGRLAIGQAQYSCIPNLEGGIVDDLLVYRLPEDYCAAGEQAFMLVVNASNIEKDFNWINKFNEFDTRVINISDDTGLLAVQGPKATQVLQRLTDIDLLSINYYTFTKGVVAGIENVLISATGYTGAGGFELYAAAEKMPSMWDAIFTAGASEQIVPVGLGARDTLRLEMGYCLYGNDIDDTTSPFEAGLGWITKLKKGDFVGRERLMQHKKEGVRRKLVGLVAEGRRVPRSGYQIHDQSGNQIGIVTSGTLSPSVEKPIGLGYVELAFASPDTQVHVVMGKKSEPAKIVKPPFI